MPPLLSLSGVEKPWAESTDRPLSDRVPFALRPLFRGWGRPDHSEMPLAHMLPIMPPLRSRGWSWISYGIDLVGREIRAYCNGFEVWKIGTVRSSGAG